MINIVMIVSTLKEIFELFCKDHKGNFILLFKVIYIYLYMGNIINFYFNLNFI